MGDGDEGTMDVGAGDGDLLGGTKRSLSLSPTSTISRSPYGHPFSSEKTLSWEDTRSTNRVPRPLFAFSGAFASNWTEKSTTRLPQLTVDEKKRS